MKKKIMWLLVIIMITVTASAQNTVLALESDTMKIPSTDGSLLIQKATDVFGKVDEDFLKMKGKMIPAPEAKIKKYTLATSSTFEKMFESLGKTDLSVFTEHQICEIAKDYASTLKQNSFNFFLFRSNSDLYVANVSSYLGDSLQIRCYRLGQGGEYYAGAKIYAPAH